MGSIPSVGSNFTHEWILLVYMRQDRLRDVGLELWAFLAVSPLLIADGPAIVTSTTRGMRGTPVARARATEYLDDARRRHGW